MNLKDIGDRILELKSNADFQYAKGKSRFIFLNYIGYMKYNGAEIQNLGYQHFRYNYTFRDSGTVTGEVFVQHQYNQVKMFKTRIVEGIGPRFRIFKRSKMKWFFAPLIMNEYEQLLDSAHTVVKAVRLDSYTSFNLDLTPVLSINHITYFQPKIENFSDFHLSSETTLRLKITKKMAFDIGYSLDYDSAPPPAVQHLFYSLVTKFVLLF
jgi:putative salt-induced outer membrane protein YdiY